MQQYLLKVFSLLLFINPAFIYDIKYLLIQIKPLIYDFN